MSGRRMDNSKGNVCNRALPGDGLSHNLSGKQLKFNIAGDKRSVAAWNSGRTTAVPPPHKAFEFL